MTRRSWIGRWLTILLLVLIALALLPPWKASSGEEVDLKNYVSKTTAFVNEEITFGTKPIPIAGAEARWDFGDRSGIVVGWPVTHTYSAARYYTVTADLVSPAGTIHARPVQIRVIQSQGNAPPVPEAVVSPQQTLAGQPISFDATGSRDPDGQISRYLWNFGDGEMSNQPKTTHSYSQAGNYLVVLTVTDNGEMDKTATVPITVTALPTAIFPGIDRVMPEPAGKPLLLERPVDLVYMGLYPPDRLNIAKYNDLSLQPPFRGVATSNQNWLDFKPAEFERISGTAVVIPLEVSIPNTNMLPRAHTSWGLVTLVINGQTTEIPVAITVQGQTDISNEVWALYQEILNYLTDKNQRGAMAYSPRYPNGADFALGLITEYIYTVQAGNQGKLTRQDFVVKVAELLMDRDENGDGIVGFTAQDPDLKAGK